MKRAFPFNHVALLFVVASLPLSGRATSTSVRLTDITVFSTYSDGSFAEYEVWETRPAENFVVWMQQGESGGPFLTGPTDANAQPNISLNPGANGFRLLATKSSDPYASFGINLFFNGSLTPSISAFGPMLTSSLDPHSFAPDGASFTPATDWSPSLHSIPGAGTLTCIIGNQQITLTDFFWASPTVYNLDSVGTSTTGPDGALDYVGGINLSITTVPEPEISALFLLLLAGYAFLKRSRVRSQFTTR